MMGTLLTITLKNEIFAGRNFRGREIFADIADILNILKVLCVFVLTFVNILNTLKRFMCVCTNFCEHLEHFLSDSRVEIFADFADGRTL